MESKKKCPECGSFKFSHTDLYRLYNTNIHEKIAEKKQTELLKDSV